jgi:hypothetical protein
MVLICVLAFLVSSTLAAGGYLTSFPKGGGAVFRQSASFLAVPQSLLEAHGSFFLTTPLQKMAPSSEEASPCRS